MLGAFGGGMIVAFGGFARSSASAEKSHAEVTGRLAESLGGIRIVKAYTAEKREELVFAKGVHEPVRATSRRSHDRRFRRRRLSAGSSSARSAS